MNQRTVQGVRTHGWTPETTQRACAALARAVAASEDEDDQLAAEFVRFVRNACDNDPDDVIEALTQWTPISPGTPQWDAIYAVLADRYRDTDFVTELKERFPDPVKALIAFADEVVPEPRTPDDHPPRQSHEIEHAHRHVFVTLLLFGTDESVEYVLSQLHKFDWSDDSLDRTREEVFQPCEDAVRAVALRLWPTLSWEERGDLVCFLSAHRLNRDQLFRLLIDTDIETLSCRDLEGYIEGLWNLLDERCIPRVQAILERALDQAEGGDFAAKRLVNLIVKRFGTSDLGSWRTEEQLRRGEAVAAG
jgi:hypothetical protein